MSLQVINLPLSVLNSNASCHSKNPSSLDLSLPVASVDVEDDAA